MSVSLFFQLLVNGLMSVGSIMSYGLLDVYKAYWEKYGYPKFPADQTSFIKFSDLGITGHD